MPCKWSGPDSVKESGPLVVGLVDDLSALAAQSVFLDEAGNVHPFDAALLVVVVVQLLKNLDGLLVR